MPDFSYGLRLYVVGVCVVVAIVGTFQWRRWLGFKTENRLAWLSLVVLNLAIGFGTVEILVAGQPGGYRNYLVALAETFLLAAVSYHPVSRIHHRRRRGDERAAPAP